MVILAILTVTGCGKEEPATGTLKPLMDQMVVVKGEMEVKIEALSQLDTVITDLCPDVQESLRAEMKKAKTKEDREAVMTKANNLKINRLETLNGQPGNN